ncbi:GNAT family N-acetyltransferase [Sinomonas terrae]|uniref:GNAT family N-acetyltransferase n=1 Tax=Sinomonas terrae TaxID=2908838 RepID=UPI0027E0A457|nr:GNAT family N-acetyltransferase [Sinomonas terrae]
METQGSLVSGVLLRLLDAEDAGPMAEAYSVNRTHLAPWEPERPEEHYTEEGQKHAIAHSLGELVRGTELPLVLVEDGTIVGRATLSSIVRGAFQKAHLGYWIAERAQGRGIMTEAAAAVVEIARDILGCTASRPRRSPATCPLSGCWPGTASSATGSPATT